MARAILLTIKDNDAAEAFIKAVTELQSEDFAQLGGKATVAGMILGSHAKLEWMAARPTAWCRCGMGTRQRKVGWTKTQRFGWWVCGNCRKCSFGVVKNFIPYMLNGARDILPELLDKLKEVKDEQAQRADIPGDSSDPGSGNSPPDPTPLAGVEVQGGDGDRAQSSSSGWVAAGPGLVDLRLPD